ncbi:MAG: hypothetical protein KIT84_34160 [Labilithrix sp.]|nr:hypothetical protein [Labilithrix sp.]MCW5816091.1 hypothetical protein [Labilithrix sp.]
MRAFAFAFVVALACGCHSRPRDAKTPDPALDDTGVIYETLGFAAEYQRPYCFGLRPVSTFGRAPVDAPPESSCPVHVRVTDAGVAAETFEPFDPHPAHEDVPAKYRVGSRRVLRVDDGFIVAYAGTFEGEVYWTSEEGDERRPISRARLVGFARAPSGTVLALGVGNARLGRGGVVALDRVRRGEYVPRLVATLPLEPSATAFDDHGRLLTYAQGFVVSIDEAGKVENLHYVARDIGRVSSLARAGNGDVFLGVECGVIRLSTDLGAVREEFWSARSGASGRWTPCEAAQTLVVDRW